MPADLQNTFRHPMRFFSPRTLTPNHQAGSRQRCHHAFQQSPQAQTAGVGSLICRTHALTFALLHTSPRVSSSTPPKPAHQQMTQPHRVTTSSLMSHRPRHSCALPREYKPTHMSRQIGPCQRHHFLAQELWTYSPTPPQSPHRSPGLLAQPGQGEGAESRPESRWPSSCDWSGSANLLTHLDKAEALGQPAGIQGLVAQGGGASSWGMGQVGSLVPDKLRFSLSPFKPTCRSSDLVLPSNRLVDTLQPKEGLGRLICI